MIKPKKASWYLTKKKILIMITLYANYQKYYTTIEKIKIQNPIAQSAQ